MRERRKVNNTKAYITIRNHGTWGRILNRCNASSVSKISESLEKACNFCIDCRNFSLRQDAGPCFHKCTHTKTICHISHTPRTQSTLLQYIGPNLKDTDASAATNSVHSVYHEEPVTVGIPAHIRREHLPSTCVEHSH